MGRAVQEPDACAFFEPGDRLRYAGCGHAEATAGFGDRAGAHDGDEAPQLRYGDLYIDRVHMPCCTAFDRDAATPRGRPASRTGGAALVRLAA